VSTNPTSFRFPPNLEGKADSEVVETIQYHDDAIQDLQQAIPSLKSQIEAIKTSTTGTTSTTENVTTSAENTIVVSGSTIGNVNNQTGATAYATQQSDYGIFLLFNDASPVAVTLTAGPAIQTPWFCWISNYGAGTVTLTPASGTINGNSSFALLQNQSVAVVFDGTNFATTIIPVVPANTPAVTGKYLTGYNSTTGAFSVSATAGISATITTAALTGGGTQGSMTFVNGILTAQVQAT
jgi:hypothetical protein